MKNILLSGLLMGLLLGTEACKKAPNLLLPTTDTPNSNTPPPGGLTTTCLEGTEIPLMDLPSAIQDYMTTNYPNAGADEVDIYDDNGTVTYDINVDGTALIFDANGSLLASLYETEIALADLPVAIQNTLGTDYPGDTIEVAGNVLDHTGSAVIAVELTSGAGLVFDASGNLLCIGQSGPGDNSNNENGGNEGGGNEGGGNDGNEISLSDLSQEVQNMLNTLYPGYTPVHADLDTLCDGTAAIVIGLEGSSNAQLDAYFTMNGTLLYDATEIASADLPATVAGAVSANYPDYVMDNHATKLVLPDGTIQYEVTMENQGTNTGLAVIFAADGSTVCEQEED